MKLKRFIVASLFLVMVLGMLFSFQPVGAQSACYNCNQKGYVVTCGDRAVVTSGSPKGNCLTVVTLTLDETYPNVPEGTPCIRVGYFMCTEPEFLANPLSGCPLGSGCGG